MIYVLPLKYVNFHELRYRNRHYPTSQEILKKEQCRNYIKIRHSQLFVVSSINSVLYLEWSRYILANWEKCSQTFMIPEEVWIFGFNWKISTEIIRRFFIGFKSCIFEIDLWCEIINHIAFVFFMSFSWSRVDWFTFNVTTQIEFQIGTC